MTARRDAFELRADRTRHRLSPSAGPVEAEKD